MKLVTMYDADEGITVDSQDVQFLVQDDFVYEALVRRMMDLCPELHVRVSDVPTARTQDEALAQVRAQSRYRLPQLEAITLPEVKT